MALTNWTQTFTADVIYDTGVLLTGSTPLGATRGGIEVTLEKEWRSPDFDGQRSPIMGMDRLVGVTARFGATMLPFAGDNLVIYEAHHRGVTFNNKGAPQLSVAEAAALSVAQAAALTMSAVGIPEPAGQVLAESRYIKNLILGFNRPNGGIMQYVFDYALCTKYSVKGADKAEGEIAVEFEARLKVTNNDLNALPYRIEYIDP